MIIIIINRFRQYLPIPHVGDHFKTYDKQCAYLKYSHRTSEKKEKEKIYLILISNYIKTIAF
jgi:hypothetical protein